MALTPCQCCGLLRGPGDAEARPCPVCGWLVGDPLPAAEAPPPPPPVEPPPAVETFRDEPTEHVRRNRLVAGGLLLAGAAAVAGMLLVPTHPAPADPADATPPETVAAVTTPPLATTPTPPTAPGPTPDPTQPPADWPRPLLTPRAEVAPYPRRVVVPPVVLRVDRPNDDFRLDRLGEANVIKLVGKARRLMIDGVDAGATLDATELAVKEVHIYGRVDGGAVVRVRTTAGGAVSVKDGVTGGARLTVDCPDGSVMLTNYKPKPGLKGVVGGGAVVAMTAKSVYFGGVVDGPGTRVELTLSAGGSFRFTEVADTAQLLYRTARPEDPLPRVSDGKVGREAAVRRVD